MRRGDVVGIARKAVTDHLGVNFRAARLGVLVLLKHHHARALAHDVLVHPLAPQVDEAVLEARLFGVVLRRVDDQRKGWRRRPALAMRDYC